MNPSRAIARWSNLPDSHLIARKEVAHALDCSTSLLSHYAYAGLLPFIPGRPVFHRVGDLRGFCHLLLRGGNRLHRSLWIEHNDRQAYSPLHGITTFADVEPEKMMKTVIRECESLWQKYKVVNKHKDKKQAKRDRVAATLSRVTRRTSNKV